jgi:hypothetical protein
MPTRVNKNNNMVILSARNDMLGAFVGVLRFIMIGSAEVFGTGLVFLLNLLKTMPQRTHSSERSCSNPHLGQEMIFFVNFYNLVSFVIFHGAIIHIVKIVFNI